MSAEVEDKAEDGGETAVAPASLRRLGPSKRHIMTRVELYSVESDVVESDTNLLWMHPELFRSERDVCQNECQQVARLGVALFSAVADDVE